MFGLLGLQWSTQVTLGDVLTVVGLLGGSLSLVFVYLQVRASAVQAQHAATAQRGRFLLDVINRYFDDSEMLRLYSLIDSDKFVFDPATYVGSPDAAAVSRTLYYFDALGFLVNQHLISLEDVAILRYRIDAFFESPQIEEVLGSYVYSPSRRRYPGHSHELARNLHRQLKNLPSHLRGID